MIKILFADLHTHTTYCDGKEAVSAMVAAAKSRGLGGIGFSGHSYAPFDLTCLGVQDEQGYLTEVREVQQKEQESGFTVLCGVEQDFYAPVPDLSRYDYFIGSVHYVEIGGEYIPIDNPDVDLREICNMYFDGNGLALAEEFFSTVLRNIKKYQPTIIGHFDLITKLNGVYEIFEEFGSAYQALAKDAMREALALANGYGGIFEVNTGGIYRDYRTDAYPASYLLQEVNDSARVLLSSDAHSGSALGFRFSEQLELLRSYGYKHVISLVDGSLQEVSL